MAYGVEIVKDVRIWLQSSFSTTFTAANDANWNVDGTDVYKLAAQDLDLSGLEATGLENPRIKNQIGNVPKPVPGLRTGNVTFSIYTGNGSSDTTDPFESTLVSYITGIAVSSPSNKTDAVEASSSTTTIQATGHGLSAGDAVLIGERSDAKGQAEVRVVASANTNDFDLEMALNATPDVSDTIVLAHDVLHTSTVEPLGYFDMLVTMQSGRCINMIGCMGGFSFDGFGTNEVPRINFDLQCAAWRWEGSTDGGTEDTFDTSSAFSDNNPVGTRAYGGFFLQDDGTTTRKAVKIANPSFDPGIAYTPLPDLNGVNGIGGFVRTNQMGVLECDVILGDTDTDMPGLFNDWDANTKKQWVLQFGSTAQSCFAIAGFGYLMDAPTPTMVDGLEAIHIRVSSETTGTAYPRYYWF